jgi:hypothetical protein
MSNARDDEDLPEDELENEGDDLDDDDEGPFETHELLDAVGHLDEARRVLGDRGLAQPPAIRDALFELHDLASRVLTEGGPIDVARTVRDRTLELSDDVAEVADAMGRIADTLRRLIGRLKETTGVEPPP